MTWEQYAMKLGKDVIVRDSKLNENISIKIVAHYKTLLTVVIRGERQDVTMKELKNRYRIIEILK